MKRVELTIQEAQYASQIASYDISSVEFKESNHRLTMRACRSLTESLLERGGVPRHRVEYFINPEYNLGRGNKSRKYYFEEGLRGGGDIFDHQDFLKYLDYFINGSKLSSDFKEKIQEVQDKCSYDSDFPDESYRMIKYHFDQNVENMHKKDFANEVFKLCLDMGFSLYISSRVQDKVMKMPNRNRRR